MTQSDRVDGNWRGGKSDGQSTMTTMGPVGALCRTKMASICVVRSLSGTVIVSVSNNIVFVCVCPSLLNLGLSMLLCLSVFLLTCMMYLNF